MGLFATFKKVGSYLFNFNVKKWANADYIKASCQNTYYAIKSTFIMEKAERKETFEEAMERLQLTNADLAARIKEFRYLMIIYLIASILIFTYSIYIAYFYKNIGGACMGFGITMFSLVNVFRYHFWIYQIRHNKLGCSLKEWFLDR